MRPASARAHPRSRGDHPSSKLKAWQNAGSSPLARGTPFILLLMFWPIGLIPARAGTTRLGVARRGSSWAHPRSRGDHTTTRFTEFRVRGSSPLARGPRLALLSNYQVRGLIPARAGTTKKRCESAPGSAAHPRSRGDHLEKLVLDDPEWGSSPLARGPHASGSPAEEAAGLIPARAGNTTTWRQCWWRLRAHPRSRGEHELFLPLHLHLLGSSPLARGPRADGLADAALGGLIPARAGNTASSTSGLMGAGAHPRSRGEHDFSHHQG